MNRSIFRTALILIIPVFAWLGWGCAREQPGRTLEVCTSPLVTSPQIPFWAAAQAGDLDDWTFRISEWKSAQQLQATVLGGRGEIWIGHIEGFARARAAGAPVLVLAVSGWRKFHLVTRDPTIQRFEDALRNTLVYTPPGSPAAEILNRLNTGADLHIEAVEARILSMRMLRGDLNTALVPEPFATSLLEQDRSLRAVEALADYYARRTGGPARIPLAGVAVHEEWAMRHPEFIERLLAAMMARAAELAADPSLAAAARPDSFRETLADARVAASLERDPILVEPAYAVASEISAYLAAISVSIRKGEAVENMLWRPLP